MTQKIFGIGLPKTGQTSLAHAMISLGYKTKMYPYTDAQIKKYQFLLDLPVALNYKNLDKKYPGSKFIFTIRDYDSWLKSMRNHYRRFPASTRHKEQVEFRKLFWGTKHFNKAKMTKRYYEHQKDVEEYFINRKKDLLVIDVVRGEGWEKLCKFLRKRKIPNTPFPKKNAGKYNSNYQ